MGIAQALLKIPWKTILTYVPTVVDTAKELLNYSSKTPRLKEGESMPQDELSRRVMRLEANERRQAELIEKMAEQQERLAQSIRILESRLLIVFIVSLFAIVFSLFVLLKTLL